MRPLTQPYVSGRATFVLDANAQFGSIDSQEH